MPLTDLQQHLETMGFGNQWQQVQRKLASRLTETNASDIQRIKEHNKKYPDKHRQAKARWARNRFQQIKDRVGKQKCNRCSSVMQTNDLIGQNRLKGHCRKCRKELLG